MLLSVELDKHRQEMYIGRLENYLCTEQSVSSCLLGLCKHILHNLLCLVLMHLGSLNQHLGWNILLCTKILSMLEGRR